MRLLVGVILWGGVQAWAMNPCRAVFSEEVRGQYQRYLDDSLQGLESMRGRNGLLLDTVYLRQDGKGRFEVDPFRAVVAPTDIALDLLVQAGAGNSRRISLILEVLETLPRHPETGLFYRLYSSDSGEARNLNLSSIDNLHLALALWTVGANRLFEGMSFRRFLDENGKIGGNLLHEDGRWELEAYRYGFGSEARSLYTVGYALGLFERTALADLPVETSNSMLQVWDGGVFQSLLPQLLIREGLYSRFLGRSAALVGEKMLSERAGHSACIVHADRLVVNYDGKQGHSWLKIENNPDEIRQDVTATHALLLAATTNPAAFSDWLTQTEGYGTQEKFYLNGFGWTDSVTMTTNGPRPNSAAAGVDKAMEVLALQQVLDPQRMTASARALWNNPHTRSRLQQAYRFLDK